MHTECSSVTGMQSATAVVLNRGCNPQTDTRTTLKIKNALREAAVASKSSEPLCDRMMLGAYKRSVFSKRKE